MADPNKNEKGHIPTGDLRAAITAIRDEWTATGLTMAQLLANDLSAALEAHPPVAGPHDPPRGWWCSRGPRHVGSCALRPRWWNVRGRWMSRG